MNIKYLSILLFSIMLSVWQVCAIPINGGQKIDDAQEISKTIMYKWTDSLSRLDGKSAGWSYDIGLFLEVIANVYARTGDQTYFDYIQKQMDRFLLPDGNIKFHDQASYNIDYVRNGKIMIYLFEKTDQQK